jgi:hypothetical protein
MTILRSKRVALHDTYLAVLTVTLHTNYMIGQRDVQPKKKGLLHTFDNCFLHSQPIKQFTRVS